MSYKTQNTCGLTDRTLIISSLRNRILGNNPEYWANFFLGGESWVNKSEIYTDSPTKLAEKHSILLCVRAPVGVINITEREICIGRGLCSLKPKNGIDFMFAFYALQTHKNHFEANAIGTTFKAIGGDTIRNEMFALPPYDEQIRTRKKIETLFYELNLISAEL